MCLTNTDLYVHMYTRRESMTVYGIVLEYHAAMAQFAINESISNAWSCKLREEEKERSQWWPIEQIIQLRRWVSYQLIQ